MVYTRFLSDLPLGLTAWAGRDDSKPLRTDVCAFNTSVRVCCGVSCVRVSVATLVCSLCADCRLTVPPCCCTHNNNTGAARPLCSSRQLC